MKEEIIDWKLEERQINSNRLTDSDVKVALELLDSAKKWVEDESKREKEQKKERELKRKQEQELERVLDQMKEAKEAKEGGEKEGEKEEGEEDFGIPNRIRLMNKDRDVLHTIRVQSGLPRTKDFYEKGIVPFSESFQQLVGVPMIRCDWTYLLYGIPVLMIIAYNYYSF